jgi:hypothetical protein
MSLSRTLLALVLFGSVIPDAHAQQEGDSRFDLKPLVPPVFKLPPNSQVSPGAPGRTLSPNDPLSPSNNFQPQTPPAPGMRITIPTSPR